jgi:hypothetical protein
MGKRRQLPKELHHGLLWSAAAPRTGDWLITMNYRLVIPALMAVGFLSTLAISARHSGLWQGGHAPLIQVPSVLSRSTEIRSPARVSQASRTEPLEPTVQSAANAPDRPPDRTETDPDPASDSPSLGPRYSPRTYQEAQAAQAARPLRSPRTR